MTTFVSYLGKTGVVLMFIILLLKHTVLKGEARISSLYLFTIKWSQDYKNKGRGCKSIILSSFSSTLMIYDRHNRANQTIPSYIERPWWSIAFNHLISKIPCNPLKYPADIGGQKHSYSDAYIFLQASLLGLHSHTTHTLKVWHPT